MHSGKKCECDSCKRSKKLRAHLKVLEQNGLHEAKAFFEELYESMLCLELDHDVAKAVIDGSWPSADEQISRHREIRALREKS